MPARPLKVEVEQNPAGRVDILISRSVEFATRGAESFFSGLFCRPVNLWDGDGGVERTVKRFCDQNGLTGFKLTPEAVAERVGLIRGQKKFTPRVRRVGVSK